MKKRIRKTGEIVDVISYNKYSSTSRNSDLDWVSYIDSRGREYEHKKGLNIYWDFEDVKKVLSTNIDWKQVRINSAISALYGFASNPHKECVNADTETLARLSVSAADALISELKKGGDNEKH